MNFTSLLAVNILPTSFTSLLELDFAYHFSLRFCESKGFKCDQTQPHESMSKSTFRLSSKDVI